MFVRSNAILLESIDKGRRMIASNGGCRSLCAPKELPSNSSIVGQLKQKVAEHRSLIPRARMWRILL